MRRLRLVFEGQWLHVASLALLLFGFTGVSRSDGFGVGELWGIDATTWAWSAIWLAVAHQVLVWFCWRTELHTSLLSRTLGRHGFTLYAVLFSVIGIARTVVVWLLAIANQETLAIEPVVARLSAIVLLAPALYLFYSVRRYFGFRRAFGADHFQPAYRDLPLVREGIFRFARNAMYVFGFLILWVPALWWRSEAALWVALFNHIYIWVHYFGTERPDMRRIYD